MVQNRPQAPNFARSNHNSKVAANFTATSKSTYTRNFTSKSIAIANISKKPTLPRQPRIEFCRCNVPPSATQQHHDDAITPPSSKKNRRQATARKRQKNADYRKKKFQLATRSIEFATLYAPDSLCAPLQHMPHTQTQCHHIWYILYNYTYILIYIHSVYRWGNLQIR